MLYKKKIELSGSVIAQKDICCLCDEINKTCARLRVRIDVEYSDGTKKSQMNLEEFRGMNFSNQKITELSILVYCLDEDGNDQASFTISKAWTNELYSLEIESSDDVYYPRLCSILDSWKTSVTQPDHSKLVKILNSWSLEVLSLSLFPFLFTSLATSLIFFVTKTPIFTDKYFGVFILTFFLLFWLLMFLFAKARSAAIVAFPLTEINIGQNAASKKRGLFWFWISFIILPIVTGIIVVIVQRAFDL